MTDVQFKSVTKFKEDNPEFMAQPIVKNFLSEEDNAYLLEKSLAGNLEAQAILDERFKKSLRRARVISYVSKLIYFYSIEYDKKFRKERQRQPLLLDKNPHEGYDRGAIVDLTEGCEGISIYDEGLHDVFSDNALIEATYKLTRKQKLILELYYLQNRSNQEISSLLNESEQNVSNLKRRAISTLSNSFNLHKKYQTSD